MNIGEKLNRKGDKILYFYDYGRKRGQRPSTGIFTYVNPKNQEQRNFNKEALKILETKKSQLTIEQQSIGTPIIPTHKFKANFLEYYEEYVKLNKRRGSRHLENSFTQFKEFVNIDFIPPVDITENLCTRFRRYLLDKFTGETPANYYSRFKWVIKAATKDKYFSDNPTEDIAAQSNPSSKLKDNLEEEEYIALLKTPCFNQQVKLAFLFSCYTGLRWVDVKRLEWLDLIGRKLVTRIIQKKTGKPVVLTLHPVALAILQQVRNMAPYECTGRVFDLPTADGANKVLQQWVCDAGINKHITWSCARLSFSILLKDQNVDDPTIAYLLGHTTTEQVQKTYKRHRPKDQEEAIGHLPSFKITSFI
ncbi:site-specific integrase [Chitinophaga polysaccharea]|uniref:site-specific integrase n=1 Tax=Chitinophaga polysaccharea TaxID=1293035 RepID=UPI001455328E|nr:site-specific integrase [Chitinophaga polysaccharea]NLR58815.1 site-specific integrase [Chitinophaga polysaccharea]